MGSSLVNVRLDAERARKVRILRERGVRLSDIVRDAIDERFVRTGSGRDIDAGKMMERIFEQYPDPPDLPRSDYDVHDRVAAREAILRKLLRSR